MSEQSGPSTIRLDSSYGGPDRQAGKMNRWLAGATVIAAMLPPTLLWAFAEWTLGEAGALLACLLLLSTKALHIADHVADFLGFERRH